ncbi:MAG: hypothetical protein AAGE52_36690 [Myxococcota bacterium]
MSIELSKLGNAIQMPALRVLRLGGAVKKWPSLVSLPSLEELDVGGKFTSLPDVFSEALKSIVVNAPLATVDPRFASIEDWVRGRSVMGVRISCTDAAIAKLSLAERAAFGSRLKASWGAPNP